MMNKRVVGTTIIAMCLLLVLLLPGLAYATPIQSPNPIGVYLHENTHESSIPGGYVGMNSSGILPTAIYVYAFATGNSTLTLTENGTTILTESFYRQQQFPFNLTVGDYVITAIVTSSVTAQIITVTFTIQVWSTTQYINYAKALQTKSTLLVISPTLLAEYVMGIAIMGIMFALMSAYISFRVDWELNMRNVTKEMKR